MEYVASVPLSLQAAVDDCEEIGIQVSRSLALLQDDIFLGFIWGSPAGHSSPFFSMGIEADDGFSAHQLAAEYLTRAIRSSSLGIHSGLFAHSLPSESWMFEATAASSLDAPEVIPVRGSSDPSRHLPRHLR